MSIALAGVSRRFGSHVALERLSIDVAPGELVGVLGPSGSGKTTMLRVIAGLEYPDEGDVYLDGEVATDQRVQDRRVGFVFQHYALFKHLTVFENIAFGLRVRPRRTRPSEATIRARVEELLALVQLDGHAPRYPSQLSGGQRQRMALARALAVEPQVLLLDEPFGALDAQVRKELRTWLRRLHDEVHVTTVFVTHDQEEAIEVADTIVVLANGQVEQAGSPHELYEQPANQFVMSFLGPVTHVGELLVRPHDVEISDDPTAGIPATVTRVVRLGFEVRVEMHTPDSEPWAQVTRGTAERLNLEPGATVYLRVAEPAKTLPVG